MEEQVNFNVGGTNFTTTWATLSKMPDSKLGKLYGEPCGKQTNYFYDRNPEVFGCILDFYRSGSLHLPETVCGNRIREELLFWGIPPENVSRCCWRILHKNEAAEKSFRLLDVEIPFFTTGKQWLQSTERVTTKIWNIMEYPSSSLLAKAYIAFYFLMVLGSIARDLGLIIISDQAPYDDNNRTTIENSLVYIHLLALTNIVFFFDILIRFIVCPEKVRFITSVINILDVLALLGVPLVTFVGLRVFGIFRILKYVRLYRVLKSNHYFALFLLAVYKSKMALLLFVSMLTVNSCAIGILFHGLESSDQGYIDLLRSVYWASITMTTVGYGDICPVTIAGRIVACVCALSGLVLLAIPMTSIARNFQSLYTRYRERERHMEPQCKLYTAQPGVVVTRVPGTSSGQYFSGVPSDPPGQIVSRVPSNSPGQILTGVPCNSPGQIVTGVSCNSP